MFYREVVQVVLLFGAKTRVSVGVNFQESGRVARGFTHTGDGSEDQAQ